MTQFKSRYFKAGVDDLGDGEHFDIHAPDWIPNYLAGDEQRGADIRSIVHGGTCKVTLLSHPDADWDQATESIPLGTLTGEGVSAGNILEIGPSNEMWVGLRITNISGAPADYIVTGETLRAAYG